MFFKLSLAFIALVVWLTPFPLAVVSAQTPVEEDALLKESTQSSLMKVPLGTQAGLLKGDHYANVLERLKERITLFFKFSAEDKFLFQKQLADKRISELVYIMTTGEGDPIEELSSRYATHINRLNDFTVNNKLLKNKESLLQMYDTHLDVLNNIQQNFEFESGWWLLLQHDINTVVMAKDKLKSI